MLYRLIRTRAFFLRILLLGTLLPLLANSQVKWPEIHQQTKPWARWWWEGSAVNNQDLTRVMEAYKKVGLGGLEITPIYGVKGQEANDLDFLSPGWMKVFEHTLKEGKRLDLGIDLATGTGWPFGGPWVGEKDASKSMQFVTYKLEGGQQLQKKVVFIQQPMVRAEGNKKVVISSVKRPISLNKNLQELAIDQIQFEEKLPLVTLMAYDSNRHALELTDKVTSDGTLKWTAPAGDWTLYAVFQGQHGKMVERAAPGGEGLVIDHFSKTAVQHYLHRFDQAFTSNKLSGLRAFFNDSYEVDDAKGQADFTPGLFQVFKKKRGYDLKDYLPYLFNRDKGDTASRVLTDYRQTIGELLLEHFTRYWETWAKGHQKIVRNQSHGSPANILDLYGAIDIPETEGNDRLRFKFASSAAHVLNKPLISSESATWLKDHFLSSLKDVKSAMDLYFLGGVNHSFFHGVAYSPLDAPWPGWLFYASVHFEPSNPQWVHFKKLNDYIARCQSFLQTGQPDNDLLQYYPLFDNYAKKGKALLNHYDGMKGFEHTDFHDNAAALIKGGYGFDFISDNQIMGLEESNGALKAPGGHYKALLLSNVELIPLATLRKLLTLAEDGGTLLIYKNLPKSVPGLSDLTRRRKGFKELLARLSFKKTPGIEDGRSVKIASLGKGKVIMGDNLETLLKLAKVPREKMVDHGLDFVRRKVNGRVIYFIVNHKDQPFKGWVNLSIAAKGAVLYNPMTGEAGVAKTKVSSESHQEGKLTVYLRLKPGESRVLESTETEAKGAPYPLYMAAGEPVQLDGKWNLSFENGGPVLPANKILDQPVYWTSLGDSLMNRFAGMGIYETTFPKPPGQNEATQWQLDLSQVRESAAVFLNGHKIGVVLGTENHLIIPGDLMKDKNVLQIKVASLMANRIRYMDRHQLNYKIFYNTNFPAHDAVNRGSDGLFTAADWSVSPAGLDGPVNLTPVKIAPQEEVEADL